MKILVVAHDAGGANNICGWVRHHPEHQYEFVLEGPAVRSFEGVATQIQPRKMLDGPLDNIDWILVGTGWKSDLERRAMEAGSRRGLRVVCFLDHWTNFRKRFENSNGEFIYPTEIWVGDIYAYRLVKDVLPEVEHVAEVPNYYMDEILERVQDYETQQGRKKSTRGADIKAEPQKIKILFLAQPISEVAKEMTGDIRGYGYTELEALERYLQYLEPRFSEVAEFRLRHHPAENPGKYEQILKPYEGRMPIKFTHASDLAEDCAWADWVVGCDTMAMAIAAMAHKQVFCCIPPGGRKMGIPVDGIKHLYRP